MVKKYKVKVLPQAQKGLKDQVAYVRRRSSDKQARKVRSAILETVKSLALLPESHEKMHELSDDQVIYRRLFKWDYRIVFTVEEDIITVFVVDIDHVADDPQKLLDRFGK
jgi:plasmid stabilization system protein ParE